MRLTLKDNPESLKRYRHLKPAGASGTKAQCGQPCPGTSHRCSRERGHRAPHVAFGLFRKVVAVWDAGAEASVAAPAPPSPKRPSPARRGERDTRRRPSLFETVKHFLAAPFSSVEELAWAVFFLVFVGFAVGGFLLIYLG